MNIDQTSGGDAFENDDLGAELGAAFDAIESGTAPAALEPIETGTEPAPVADRNRDPLGRFAPKPEDAPAAPAAPQPETPPAGTPAAEPPEAPQSPAEPAAVRPPPGWSPQSKAAFAALPDHIKADIAKRETEVNQGLAKLQEYKGLDDFAAAAKRAGFSAGELGQRFLAAEQKLASNFLGGVSELAQTFGHHPVAVAAGLLGMHPQTLVGMVQAARQQGGQAPQGGQPQPAQGQPAVHPQIAQAISGLQQTVHGMVSQQQATRQQEAARTIDGLFDNPKYPYAANVEAEILTLLKQDQGFRTDPAGAFERAYQTAVYMNAETRSLLIKQERDASAAEVRAAAAQRVDRARAGTRSVTGSPLAGASTQPARASTGSLQSDLEASWDAIMRPGV